MTRQQLLKKCEALPPAARKQVDDLLAMLALSEERAKPQAARRSTFGPDDEVFGMWRDRDDIIEGAAWVRNLRRRQWERRIGRSAD
jgi:hypothetical protein